MVVKPRGRDGAPLQETTLSLHLEQPHEPGQNLLWCVTSELALARIERALGGPLRFAAPPEDTRAALEAVARSRVDTGAIDERFYVAAAGRWSAEVDAALHAECQEKFASAAEGLVPAPGLFAYCQLRATLKFERPLDRLADPLEFGGELVHSFGLKQFAQGDPRLQSVLIHAPYHDEPDEVWARGWIVELLGAPERARVIVASVAPGATLGDTVDDVLARLRPDARDHPDSELADMESLEIPVVDIALERELLELTGLALDNEGFAGEGFGRGAQTVMFRLDENGADLKSVFALGGCATRLRRFVVDRPFLVLMLQRDGDVPLLAAWIETPELLERAAKLRVRCPESWRPERRALDLEALADKLARQRPRELEVVDGLMPRGLVPVLAQASRALAIESLHFRDVEAVGESFRALADGDWRALERLTIAYSDLSRFFGDGEDPLGPYLAACEFPKLTSLTLVHGHVGDARGLFAALPDTLTILAVEVCRLACAPEMFAEVERFPSLARVYIEEEEFSDACLEALLDRVTSSLTHLWLRSRAITDRGARALARCAALRGLKLLDLSCTAITDDGVIALAEASQLAGLRRLNLPFRRVGDRGYAALEASPYITYWLPPRH
ncbi:MAG: hypothetical protein KC468_09515 [Myxococcales bacterium]|nr:hypothetical protein [Myxococcales bacterium]